MRMDLDSLQRARSAAFQRNRYSKFRQTRMLRIVREEWHMVWPDLTVEVGEPAVENVLTEAAEDKTAMASAIPAEFHVPARRGTRKDDAEVNAQKGRRIFKTLAQHTDLDSASTEWYMDWHLFGIEVGLVWQDFHRPETMPYATVIEPGHFYPLSWTARRELREGLIITRKSFADLQAEYGRYHPAFARFDNYDPNRLYEEITWADETHWARAIAHERGFTDGDFSYRKPSNQAEGRFAASWLIPPHEHLLDGCPIVARKAHTGDREIRGKLDGMLPNLKNAHEWQTEFNLLLRRSAHAPRLEQNIDPNSEYGPDAKMKGVPGPDKAVLEYPRPPVEWAMVDQIDRQLESSRGAGHYPRQRSGDPGASIASGDAVQLLTGSFNSLMAWAQKDHLHFLRALFTRLANADEKWSAPGRRDIDGFDAGEAYTDSYDPTTFWKGDYRVFVSFPSIGVDTHTNLLNMGAAHRLGWLPSRDAMRRSGLVDNPLAAERQKALEYGVELFEKGILPQMVQAGDFGLYQRYMEMVDSDQFTPQAAFQKLLEEMAQQAAQAPAEAPPPQVTPELLALAGGGGPPR